MSKDIEAGEKEAVQFQIDARPQSKVFSPPNSNGNHSLPIEFRTLSIQVTDSQHVRDKGKPKDDTEYFASLEFHKMSSHEVSLRFNTSDNEGLDSASAEKRLQRNGPNVLEQRKPNYVRKLLGYIFGGFCAVLWVGVLVFFLCWQPLSDPPSATNLALAILVLIVIFLQASFSAFQDWSTSRVMKSILNMIPSECLVLRDGQLRKMPATNLVVGDIVHLKLGNKVPADIRLLQTSNDLKLDRSILTGESDAIDGVVDCTDDNFLESKNIALMGTHVVNGSGAGVVVLTGGNTVMGRISKLTSSRRPKVPLIQQEINRFVRIIVCLTIVLASMIAIVWGAWLRAAYPDFLSVVGMLVNVMGCVVAFIPEGMPVGVALTLMMVARRMRQNNILPKALTTVETLGCVNVICSDKTGTLTQNKMFVTSVGFLDNETNPDNCRDTIVREPSSQLAIAYRQLQLASLFCNNATFDPSTMDRPVADRLANGDATDCALLRFSEHVGSTADFSTHFQRVFEIPFNSKNKWMLTMYQAGSNHEMMEQVFGGSKQSLVLVKGAPDVLLPKCTSVLSAATNSVVPLSSEAMNVVTDMQQKWSRNGERVLILCRRFYTPAAEMGTNDFQEEITNHAVQDLTIIGLIGIMDPPRPEIKDTVAKCRKAGTRFFMVTGDFGLTAAAIARQIGIFTTTRDPDTYDEVLKSEGDDAEKFNGVTSLLLTGTDIQKMGDSEWDRVCKYEEIVFARTTPEQKLRIVNEFKKRDGVVAVTGDGVNDAPALKAADVGVAVVSGSDVAIEAADLVLLDKFDSITEAIRLGRLVFQNLQKVIGYLLPAGSWSEIWPVLINVFFGTPLPLSAFLMIMICCFTDLFPCLALIMEQEEYDLLSQPPRNSKKDHLITFKIYLQSYGFIGTLEAICSEAMFFTYLKEYTNLGWYDLVFTFGNGIDWSKATVTKEEFNNYHVNVASSITFITLVIIQWGNILSIRNRKLSILQADPIRPKRRNLWLFLGMLFSFIVAIIVTEIPWINNLFYTAPVPIKYWLIPFPMALGILLVDEVRKLLVRSFPNGPVAKMAW
ncbi:uncharacterized protein VTP21DRAFT_9820 [Calcarisporiella thermophila]|uniref:uncharacterized protein n=1 Tax=Calcarisporiella thermophila TaxID=911321 RepID=UPI0037426190